jgi:thymidine phosphorylase
MAMAICLNGMDINERVALTMAMANSGDTIDWKNENLDGPVLDKHSTGGVGDKVSLMLAPIIQACGGYVPMISGRGLGHTGGTLDKMDSIPGYVSQPDIDLLKKTVKEVGCAIVGATAELAPADRTIYAIRDITATVEDLSLITSSILSKKLAAGLEGLVMDVKFGTGAFMQKYDDAKELAESIVNVANGAGLPCSALLTDMNQVLGNSAGNAIEVREAIEFLRCDEINERLYEVTTKLSAELLVTGEIVATQEDGLKMIKESLESGKAAEAFDKMVHSLGGPANIIETFDDHLKLAPIKQDVFGKTNGIVKSVDTRLIGLSIIELGGGRRLVSDKIDYGVGINNLAAIGEEVNPYGKALGTIYSSDEDKAEKAAEMIREAYELSPVGEKIEITPVVNDSVT